ncbi:MAG: AAA family ATPase [Cyclobacteriaceae bacterium]
MKINKIVFENINALKGRQKIDFTQAPFDGAGLFAITGPTGAGKSTILDVITLALFNRIPRFESGISKESIKKLGSIITRHTQSAFAEIEYEAKGLCYRSRWSIAINRNGNLNDYDMELASLPVGELLCQKKSEVPIKNEQIIGLSYDQFVRSILLSQGDFAKFLHSGKNERSQLLEQITGTWIYRQIGIQAFEKNKQIKSHIENQRLLIGQIAVMTSEDQLALEQATVALEKSLQHKDVEREKLEKLVQVRSDLNKSVNNVHKFEKELEQNAVQWQQFKEKEERLQKHKLVSDFQPQMIELRTIEEQGKSLRKDKEEASDKLQEASLSKDKILNEASQKLKQELSDHNFETILNEVKNNYRNIFSSLKENESVIGRLTKSINDHLGRLPEPQKISKAEHPLVVIEKNIADTKLKIEKTGIDHNISSVELQDRLEKLEQMQEVLRQLVYLLEKKNETDFEMAQAMDQKKGLEEIIQKLGVRLQIEAEENTLIEKELLVNKEKYELEKRKADLTEHRKNLQPGVPCPLCGATDHPFATNSPTAVDAVDEQIKLLEARYKAQSKEWQSTKVELASTKNMVQEIEKKYNQSTLALSENNLKIQNLVHLQGFSKGISLEDVEKKRLEVSNEIANIRLYEKLQETYEKYQQLLGVYEEKLQLEVKSEDLKHQLSVLYTGNNFEHDVNSWATEFTKQNNNLSHYQPLILKLNTQLEVLHQTYQEKFESLKIALNDRGVATIKDAESALLSAQEIQDIEKQQRQLQEVKIRLQTSVHDEKSRIESLKTLDFSEQSTENIIDELRELKLDINSIRVQTGANKQKLKSNEEALMEKDRQVDILQRLEKDAWKWQVVNEMIGDAKGNKFSNVIQNLTLKQLTYLANHRLKELTDRYLLQAPDDDNDDIEVIDQFQGNLRRSIKTLSGGETFLISLSLALGLSDMASQNVQIGCLFIDEGFGTLDSETLDVAISTLEKLQAESSKLIGIISHVSALKERITCQVKLIKLPGGFSTIVQIES